MTVTSLLSVFETYETEADAVQNFAEHVSKRATPQLVFA